MAVKASATITLSFMVDVSAVYRYYKLQASTASTPSVPTSFPPAGWTDTEPNYTSGSTQTLYTVDCTVFANDTFLYSAVSKSSSYEASKEAYNKAQNALDVANSIPGYKHLVSEYVVDQATVDAWCAEGLSDTWTVLSTAGIRVGDTVAVRMSNSTTNQYVFGIATVTQITSSTVFVGTSHGYIDPSVSDTAQEAKAGVDDINAGKPLFSASGANGTAGYVEMIVIEYNSEGSYLNKPIRFYMNQRGIGSYTMTFAWENTSGIPALAHLTTDRKLTSALAVKWSDYMCSIYIQKSEAWDSMSIMGVENPYTNSEVAVTFYTDNACHSASDLISWTDKGSLLSVVDEECATNYITCVNGALMISDMTDPARQFLANATWQSLSTLTWADLEGYTWSDADIGKNVLIDSDGVKIRHNTTNLASFGANSIEFDQAATFKADGVLVDNGDAFAYLGRNTVLWTGGASGYWMNASQSITLSANITRQISGAVFAWSLYQSGAAVDSDWHFIFVPKYQVSNFGGNIVRMHDAYLGMNKILYVSNGNVSGHAQNGTSGTTNGIAWDNSKWVLRYIVGV